MSFEAQSKPVNDVSAGNDVRACNDVKAGEDYGG